MKGTNIFKRTITITILAMIINLLTCINVHAVNSSSSNLLIGDINSDGFINSVDATMILQHYAKKSFGSKTEIDEELADVNGDGEVNSIDATMVLTKYAKAACGRDTSVWPPYSISRSLLKSGHSYTFLGGIEIPLYTEMGVESSCNLSEVSTIKVEKYCLGKWYSLIVDNTSYYAHIRDEQAAYFQSLMPENTILSSSDELIFTANSYCLYNNEQLEEVVTYINSRDYVRIIEPSMTVRNSYKVQINDKNIYWCYIDQTNLNQYFADLNKTAFNQ